MKNGKPKYTKEPPGVAAAIRDSVVVKDFLPPPSVLRHAERRLITVDKVKPINHRS